jgi:arsenite-transporting ATPase
MSLPRARRAPGAGPGFHFVGGKGGVGKTTWAAARAIAAADAGRRVLLVSSDPAHSLGDALGVRLGPTPRTVPSRRGRLLAVELDADRALARWLGRHRRHLRTIAERGTYLDEEDVERLLRLSFPGVDELMGLVELDRLARSGRPEEVVVDTAPTGHTLRLLAMPETLRRIAAILDDMHAKHRFLAGSLGSGYLPDAADRLIAELAADGRALHELLRDPARARFTWLLLPEPMAFAEAVAAVRSLGEAGIAVGEIVVNRLTRVSRGACAECRARAGAERRVLAGVAPAFPGARVVVLDVRDEEPRGPAALRAVAAAARPLSRTAGTGGDGTPSIGSGPGPALRRGGGPAGSASARPGGPVWLDAVVPAGLRLLVVVGKGGVGKTTAATATALLLAARRPGARVLLLSTDPAHSLGDVLATPIGDGETVVAGAPEGLRARELDAERAFADRRDRYRAAVDELFEAFLKGSRFDVAYDRQVVQELMDLAPPGLDEVFGILSVTEALLERQPAPYDIAVVDTAPTGHALRLLAMPGAALAWTHALLAILLKYRDVIGLGEFAADLLATARNLRQLEALLRDPARCRALVVTRAAHLPRAETGRLLAGLRRLRIPVGGVLVDAVTRGTCAACRRRARGEQRVIDALQPLSTPCLLVAPAVVPPPRGVRALVEWGGQWEEAS